MSNLKNKTGERVLPAEASTGYDWVIYLRHLFAYETAIREIPAGGAVLDMGCGEGYGTSLLSKHASLTRGIDVSAESAGHAKNKYAAENLSYQVYNGRDVPFPDASFDAATSFQVIEHVKDDRHYAAEARRVLKSPGILLLSTPNRVTRLKPNMKPWNRFHVREYDAEGLHSLLRTEFREVEMFGVCASDVIHNMELIRARQNLKIASLDPFNLRHLLPEPMIPGLIRLLRAVIYRDPADKPSDDFKDKYSTADFFLSKDRLDDSLDLFAICRT